MATKHTITINITQVHEIEIISDQPPEEFDAMDIMQHFYGLIDSGDKDYLVKEKMSWDHSVETLGPSTFFKEEILNNVQTYHHCSCKENLYFGN